jgi:hypothetical protein
MTEDPHAREIGRVEDDRGRVVIVGVDHDTVTLRTLHTRTSGAVTLSSYRAEEFGQLLVSACWQAGWHQGHASGQVAAEGSRT